MAIVQTVDLSMFRDAFVRMDRKENFSWKGIDALFNYFEEYSEETGQHFMFDVIAICCDYTEDDAQTINDSYSIGIEREEDESEEDFQERLSEEVKEYLEDNTQVVMSDNGTFVYANF